MDGKKEVGSSSSLPPELFGPNPMESPPPSSSSGLFASIFPPPSNEVGSSSSFPSELFGPNPKDSPPPSSSSGLFDSIFPPPSNVIGRNSSTSELMGSWQKQTWDNEVEHDKEAAPGNGLAGKEQHSIFQEHRVEPCHLSSSLYYGGQDVYSYTPSTQNSGSKSSFKKDEDEDDPNGNNSNYACRGNWWQGSLYY